jgi:hypothetical protein
MEYARFRQLLKAKEGTNLDFKLACDAFLSKRAGAKAELAKDVCAMANNGWRASYIVVGVSDDGKHFESVCNPKLTEENVQAFCKGAVFPPPRIRVFRPLWITASPQHKGKRFVIIQVGPQARQCFRLARDFVSYKERVCYRRNEVWIRRGSTSDLATPEEIARLLKGQPAEQEDKPEDSIDYLKLPRDRQISALTHDLEKWVEEVGGASHNGRIVLRLGRTRYVWRCVVRQEYTDRHSFSIDASNRWCYEHGLLFLTLGPVSKRALPTYAPVHFKEKWGWLTVIPRFWLNSELARRPPMTDEFSVIALTLPRLSDTAKLRASLSAMLHFLDADETARALIPEARQTVNHNLRRGLRKENAWHPSAAQAILELSAGRLP